jgi:hypothetical protein
MMGCEENWGNAATLTSGCFLVPAGSEHPQQCSSGLRVHMALRRSRIQAACTAFLCQDLGISFLSFRSYNIQKQTSIVRCLPSLFVLVNVFLSSHIIFK